MLSDAEINKIIKDIDCVLGYGSSWDAVHYLEEIKAKLQENVNSTQKENTCKS